MKKIGILITLFSALIIYSCSAQNRTVDSLLNLIKKDKPDTNKVNHLNALGWELRVQNPDTSIILGIEALNIITPIQSLELNSIKNVQESKEMRALRARALGYLGVYYDLKGDYFAALEYSMKALQISEEINNKKGMAGYLSNIGNVYFYQGAYPKALDYYFKSLKIQETLGNKIRIGTNLGSIANVYRVQADYSKALEYYLKALKIDEETKNNYGISINLGNLGNLYNDRKDYPNALKYYNKALKLAEEFNDENQMASWMCNIGNVNVTQKNYLVALSYYKRALIISERQGIKSNLAATLSSLGSLYIITGKFNEAEECLKRAISINENVGVLDYLYKSEEALSELYDSTGRHKEAFIHYKKAVAIKDSLFSQENKKQLVRKEMNYEFEKKEAATKAEHDKQIAVAEAEKKKQWIVLMLVSCVLVLVVLFAGFVVRSLRIARKQKNLIESQKFQIVESINYSKKIQNSLLPNLSDMEKSIAGLFVFYQPKDIVSGDFYYFQKFEKYTLLACVDCTGHGVPGGFMSTLGSLLLDKIVNSELLSPSEILTKLSDEIIRVLHQQSGGEIQDGMDLSICLIDHNNKKIQFSGARNGIIVVSEEETKRYKADALPVGGNYMKKGVPIDRRFNTQTISINQNDWIYMYTDGFMEQAGGQGNIPMNYAQFEEHLKEVSKEINPEAKNKYLQTKIDSWRGVRERDDDILIMGFQIN
ncbi:MAG: tetratricopeptide repeat protein [Bacteroidota bacterium]